jgi:hypothetical protein
MRYVPRKYDYALIEALALNGALKPNLDGRTRRKRRSNRSPSWLGRGDPEAKWTGEIAEDGGYLLKRLWRGVTDAHVIEKKFLARPKRASSTPRRRAGAVYERRRCFGRQEGAAADRGAKAGADRGRRRFRSQPDRGRARRTRACGKPVTRPSELLEAVLAAGRKGLSIQRYKGLGEMNAEQLWETTLDPANRSLLRVEVAQADVADEIFTRYDGRRRRAAARVHPGQCAQRRQSRRLRNRRGRGPRQGWRGVTDAAMTARPSPSPATICARRSVPTAPQSAARARRAAGNRRRRRRLAGGRQALRRAASAVPHELIDEHGLYKPVPFGIRHKRPLEKARKHAERMLKVDTRNIGWHGNALLVKHDVENPRLRGAPASDARAARGGDGRAAASGRPAAPGGRHASRPLGLWRRRQMRRSSTRSIRGRRRCRRC